MSTPRRISTSPVEHDGYVGDASHDEADSHLPEGSEPVSSDEPRPLCPEPNCGLPATQQHVRDINTNIHEVTGTCEAGHLWTTKWFAERSA